MGDILDFNVSDWFYGENVAVLGRFTWRSEGVGNPFTAPCAILAKVNNGKMIGLPLMEDTRAAARSFRSSGKWQVHTDPGQDTWRGGQ